MLLDLIQMVHITVAVPLIKLFTYTDQGVEIKKNMLHKLERINGIAKYHKVLCINNKMIMKKHQMWMERNLTSNCVSHFFPD